jgi:hypothetical protein
MQRLKMLGLLVMAVFAFAAVAASSASAVALPVFSVATGFTGTSEAGELKSTAASIKCKKDTSEGGHTSNTLGPYTIDFKECTLGGEECKSLGGSAGLIQVGGEWHLVRLKTEDAGIWFLVPLTHIECKLLATLVLVLGSVLGLITPILKLTNKFEIAVKAPGGVQAIKEYENDAGAKVAVSLKSSADNGEEGAATENSEENKITTEKETEIEKTT